MRAERILIVVGHPDDEVLGCGATVAKWTAGGAKAATCILSAEAEARARRPSSEDLLEDTMDAQEIIGVGTTFLGDFPNIRFNTVPHIELVRFIEDAIRETQPDVILTHHPRDLNDDHRQVSLACQAAARLYQRETSIAKLRALLFMEVLSSTDWSFDHGQAGFRPTAFVEIHQQGLDLKIQALRTYRDVMRPYPHPRSAEAIRALATLRGSHAGLDLAEAFEIAFVNFSS